MKKIDISIIIVAYNSSETIQECIDSVQLTIKRNSYEIIVSDNSQNDETKNVIQKLYGKNDQVVYIHNSQNLGFSKGNNVAIKQSSGNYKLFLNPDTKVYEGTIDGMVDFMRKNPQAGAATCFVELPSGILDDSSHRGFPTPMRALSHFSGLSRLFPKSKLFGGYNMTFEDLSKTHEIDSLAGSFMIVPTDIGERLKWWDEDYFFYGEDIDFCYRIKKMGLKIYFVPEYKALHMKGISSGIKKVSQHITKASSETRKFATHHRFMAMKIFYDKHYKSQYSPVVTALVKLGIFLKSKSAGL